jgi:hypothetical protein
VEENGISFLEENGPALIFIVIIKGPGPRGLSCRPLAPPISWVLAKVKNIIQNYKKYTYLKVSVIYLPVPTLIYYFRYFNKNNIKTVCDAPKFVVVFCVGCCLHYLRVTCFGSGVNWIYTSLNIKRQLLSNYTH